jgi:HAD superfamily hydrolase (TIGR01484 family)
MKITNITKVKPKKLIVFDLDGTLVPTKSPMDQEMTKLIVQLLETKKVAIIGGGKYQVFQKLFIKQLSGSKANLHNLFLFPTTSTAFYRYNKGWKKVYSHGLSKVDRSKIKKTFHKVFAEIGYKHPKKTYGQVIEDRGTQVTFSALGQDIVTVLGMKGVALKEKWKNENNKTKLQIAKLMAKYLPHLEVRAAGHTSVDVTGKGIDKAFGLRQIEKYLKVKIKDMLFIGDAIFPGGNDYAVTKTKVDYIKVSGPEQTKKLIKHLI